MRTQVQAEQFNPAFSAVTPPSASDQIELAERLAQAKRAFVTRRADLSLACGLTRKLTPRPGDLVLASVDTVGLHRRIELLSGRRAQLYPGDEIVAAYGVRYAPDQFDGVLPEKVAPCHLVAGGGIAARMRARHAKVKNATTITPAGILVGADGTPLNLSQFALPARSEKPAAKTVLAIAGTSMNAGKTTLAANIVRGLSQAGVRVGACKVTGTGSGGDIWSVSDAGAVRALDFTDVGFATTADADIAAVEAGAHALVSELEASNVDIVVVEIADGLLQRETAALLDPTTSSFAKRIDAMFLAAADAMGAMAGVEWMRTRNLPLRAVSGLVTASPLAAAEAQRATGAEVVSSMDFGDPETATKLCLRAPVLRGAMGMAS